MFQAVLKILVMIWIGLCITIGLILSIAPMLPSDATILITNDLLLNDDERFHLYNIAWEQSYRFTPSIANEAFFASLAPRGRRLALLNVNLNQFSLMIMDFSGRIFVEEIPINSVLYFDEAQWSDDGHYFMYFDKTRQGVSIFILDITSQNTVEIPIGDMPYPSASWTKDRQRLVFTHNNGVNTISQIWLADGNGNNQVPLTHNDNDSYCPVWSPNGETVAYLEQVPTGERLRYIDADSGEEANYYSDVWLMTGCPRWSSDGNKLLFVSLDGNTRQTTAIQLDIISGDVQEILEVNQTVNLQLWR